VAQHSLFSLPISAITGGTNQERWLSLFVCSLFDVVIDSKHTGPVIDVAAGAGNGWEMMKARGIWLIH
jgi:hypothetical protein